LTALGGGPYPAISGIAAAADDASVASTNPAGMTRFDKRVTRAEILAFFSDNTWEGQVGDEGPEFRSTSNDTTVVPSGKMVMPVRDNLWFGFTVLGSGFSGDFEKDWPGRYFIQDYDLLYISAFPSLATRLSDKLSVAASLALTYTSYEQIKAVPNLDPDYDDGTLKIDTDGWSVGWALSALYEVTPATRFGLTYRSEIDPELDGKAKFSGLSPIKEGILDAVGLLNANVEVASSQPRTIIAGVYHEFTDSSAMTLDLLWSDFSEFTLAEMYVNDTALVENEPTYDDIFAVSASYSRRVADRWRVGFGGFITNDMVEDEDRTVTFRVDSVWSLGAGVKWRWKEDRWVSMTINYLKVDDAPVNTPAIPGIGPVTGRYTERGTIYLNIALALGD
jgi:long-chain fatty acid transport protein